MTTSETCGRLSAEYLAEAEQDARRFSGAYTGTSGTLAAHTMRLLKEVRGMTQTIDTLEADNQALRDAVAARHAALAAEVAEDPIPVDWILRGQRELRDQLPAPAAAAPPVVAEADDPPAARLLLEALAAVRQRRSTYGPPADHFRITVALVNAAFGTSFTPADWATIMILDKVARSRGPGATSDNDIDIAGYAACRHEVATGPAE